MEAGIYFEVSLVRAEWSAGLGHVPLTLVIRLDETESDIFKVCRFFCIFEGFGLRLAPLNRFKPSSKVFYWPFQGGTSFVDLLCFCSVLCLICLCARLFICALWSPAGKGLASWLSFVVSTVSLSLSHLYPGSGVVLDCIDSWSLHPYLLCF